MSDPGTPIGGGFFESLLGDFIKLLDTRGPALWETVTQLAQALATEGLGEDNVDPLERIRIEEIARVAELHVAEITGLATSMTGRPVTVAARTRAEWATVTLDAWRPLFEAMTAALSSTSADTAGETGGTNVQPPSAGSAFGVGMPPAGLGARDLAALFGQSAPGEEGDESGIEELLGRWAAKLEPVLLAMQFGSTIGHLSRTVLAQYDLPLPRPASDEIVMVPANILAFADEWSLPADDVRMWVALREVASHAVLARQHVRERIESLVREYIDGFAPMRRGGSQTPPVDLTDPASLERALQDPSSLLGEMETPDQARVLANLEAVVAAMAGYVDHVVDVAGRRLIASFPAVSEALRRRRVTRGQGQRFAERFFGLRLDQAQYDRGDAFVAGAIERAGDSALARLWESASTLPTPAELDAPGLWLARIDLPAESA
ncbi:MAG: zinc-dependent metalloprotease [Actinomycetota bacterium]|nr:zinc-dependent metalloprotease [Actinomycetota bacterium]